MTRKNKFMKQGQVKNASNTHLAVILLLLSCLFMLSLPLTSCNNVNTETDHKKEKDNSFITVNESNEKEEESMKAAEFGDLKTTMADQIPYDEQEFFYKNPANINNIGDPFVIRDRQSKTYTAVATSASIGFYGWDSEDLVHWKSQHWMYKRPDDAWSTDSYWAPEIVFYRDKYYMFYTARNKEGRLLISVAVADEAKGPYTDVSSEPVFDPGYAIIDASVFIDDDGQAYLYYSKDCSENIISGIPTSQIYGVKLTADLLHTEGEAVLLASPEQDWENKGTTVWNEGPNIIKHNNIYYLAYSANFFADPAYSVGYAKSNNPLGPFTKAKKSDFIQ